MDLTKVLIGIGIVLVLGGAGWFVLSGNQTDDAMMQDDEQMMEKDDAMMEEEDTMQKDDAMMKDEGEVMMKDESAMMKSGSYEAYAPEKLAKADSGKVILFFRASWCPTCRTLDADIKSHLGDIPEGVTILDLNYDNSTALKQKYGVTYQHTLVQVDSEGNQIAKWDSSPTLAALLTEVQ